MSILNYLELCKLEVKPNWQEMANPNPAVPTKNTYGKRSMLNLNQPFLGTWQIVVGNSAFDSVIREMQLAKEGLGYIGVVKTETKQSPIEPL